MLYLGFNVLPRSVFWSADLNGRSDNTDVVTLQPLPLTSTNHELNIMTTLLWLDDERDPTDSRWHRYFPVENPTVVWVKTYEEFVEWVNVNSLPDAICFDHDLGDGLSGMDAAKWLTEYCLDRNQKLPLWSIQSANPIGKMNITALLNSFARAF